MPSTNPLRLLAIETSTDTLSVALGACPAWGVESENWPQRGQFSPDSPFWHHTGPGAAQSSLTLLPVISALLAEAGWQLADLDALVFARGPGSFTGLRTACAVVQGLAYGARSEARPEGLPVLPIDTLAALAEQARQLQAEAGQPAAARIAALLDARMGELYVGAYRVTSTGLLEQQPPRLCAPDELAGWWRSAWPEDGDPRADLLASNAFDVHGAQFSHLPGQRQPALPNAQALLRLAPAALARGEAVRAHQALPLYVRDKVAQTTAEREALRQQQLVRLAAPTPAAPLDV